RAAGAQLMLERGARWLAFTDADTVVPYAWLSEQVAFGVDAVCGIVEVGDWSEHSEQANPSYATEATHTARSGTSIRVHGGPHLSGTATDATD
nr:hypothetical protein [Tanacetum cinerariifolium]